MLGRGDTLTVITTNASLVFQSQEVWGLLTTSYKTVILNFYFTLESPVEFLKICTLYQLNQILCGWNLSISIFKAS